MPVVQLDSTHHATLLTYDEIRVRVPAGTLLPLLLPPVRSSAIIPGLLGSLM